MRFNPDTSQKEYSFGNIEIVTQELNRLGFSLENSLFSNSGEIYHVVPSKIQDDYPKMSDGRTPRFVAVVDSKGKLTYDKPYDNNSVLIGYQEILDRLDLLTTSH